MSMAKIKLPDNSTLEIEVPVAASEIARKISRSLSEDALAVKISGKVSDLDTTITGSFVAFMVFADRDSFGIPILQRGKIRNSQ